ncbi:MULTISPECIES: MoxR family ATPase [Kosmotoga]|uniref:ATPase associated with various cellular activities AAA_3 n=1 Tax=Kosmotoga olearia (strain ATCC BAA-1733 / DSM 21960 / TBF 19.5.1) TaxID=521045 RepID=C5CDY2_KOSOT|nr:MULTISPECIES: MoxR family ATPase [Kosmotoga]ACR79151.1 ATPase associated with various cellular activities AAA_3 [Kosmotoga olearia TBF 19.5.1]MDI3524208.1 MoxR-like ATPase [Kosmotoga sp.]MDK2953800.1 MoxR-like ATPase [Kosmotoga sp.]OAA23665.1 magnesium chelatase [Kosmotoga sp. DU53]
MQVKKFGEKVLKNIAKVIIGKDNVIEKTLAVMISGGHVLLNDVPGVGKTMLARSLAISLGLEFKRIQCTPDLLPTDITGLNVLDMRTKEFVFRPGPIFTDILLADEVNRTTPRTQSALLEAMAEKQVTIDGKTYPLNDCFFVIATQNPVEFEGTFSLPEAQLDRFSICLSMGYPDKEQEIKMLEGMQKVHPIESIKPVTEASELTKVRELVKNVRIDPSILEYITTVVENTRKHPDLLLGSSPRGSIALMNISRGLAALSGRNFVIPDDVKKIAVDVLSHRIMLKPEARLMKRTPEEIIHEILNTVEVPLIND